MDKASDYESGDSRFESWRGRLIFLKNKENIPRSKYNLCFPNSQFFFLTIYQIKCAFHSSFEQPFSAKEL